MYLDYDDARFLMKSSSSFLLLKNRINYGNESFNLIAFLLDELGRYMQITVNLTLVQVGDVLLFPAAKFFIFIQLWKRDENVSDETCNTI